MPVSTAEAGRLSISLIRLMKVMKSIRTHAPRLHPAIETAAYPIMFNLVAGPRRVSALAECVHSDVSTVSRQTSALVDHGLLEKVRDPEDGRGWLISLTSEGEDLIHRLGEQRAEWFAQLLGDWDASEVESFARSVDRLTEACERSHQRLTAPDSDGAHQATDSTSKEQTV